MNYPVSEVLADLRLLGLSEVDLAVLSGVRLSILRAWILGQIDPCEATERAVLRALQSARALRRRYGCVPLDDDTIRWVREQQAAINALAQ